MPFKTLLPIWVMLALKLNAIFLQSFECTLSYNNVMVDSVRGLGTGQFDTATSEQGAPSKQTPAENCRQSVGVDTNKSTDPKSSPSSKCEALSSRRAHPINSQKYSGGLTCVPEPQIGISLGGASLMSLRTRPRRFSSQHYISRRLENVSGN